MSVVRNKEYFRVFDHLPKIYVKYVNKYMFETFFTERATNIDLNHLSINSVSTIVQMWNFFSLITDRSCYKTMGIGARRDDQGTAEYAIVEPRKSN